MFCTKCGKEIPYGSKFCTSCGAMLEVDNSQQQNAEVPPPIYSSGSNNLSPAQEIISKSSRFKRKYVGIAIAAVVVVIFIALSMGGGNSVNTVKNGTFNGYPEQTVDEAFKGFFSNPEWSSYSENGNKYVKFTGNCTLYEEMVNAKIIFFIDGKNFTVDTFKIGNINVTTVNDLESILDKIYAE